MSNAKSRNSRDIPYWFWEGILQDGKGFHLIRGLIYARHTAWMTETHNPSKFIASTHAVTSHQLGRTRVPKQEKAGSDLSRHNYIESGRDAGEVRL